MITSSELQATLGWLESCDFIKSLTNRDICDIARRIRYFATHCDYWGLPKAVMEPLLDWIAGRDEPARARAFRRTG